MSRLDHEAWIVDASVALKWFMPPETEPDSEVARQIIGKLPLRTTSLAFYEVGNVLTRLTDFDQGRVTSSLETMLQVCGEPVELEPSDYGTCAEIASTCGITFYDASYVAIARRMGRTVLSADSDLLDPGLARDLNSAVRN